MSKKKIGDTKIEQVRSTKETSGIESTEAVSGVSGVKATTGVGGVKRTGGVGKASLTTALTTSQRDKLFSMIHEEAEKVFAATPLSKTKRETIETAVKMAIDASLVDDENDADDDGEKKAAKDKPK